MPQRMNKSAAIVRENAKDELNATNYQAVASGAVEKYSAKNMILDAFFWSSILSFYRTDLKERDEAIKLLADALEDCVKWIDGPRIECKAETQNELIKISRRALRDAQPFIK